MSNDYATSEMVLNVFRHIGVLQEGHFLLTSGRHSDKFLQYAHIFEHPRYAVLITALLAEKLKGEKVDLVIGPAVGGISIAYELARQIGARTVFTERENGKMALKRGFSIKSTDNVVIAEDMIATGGSVREVSALIKAAKANLAAVAVAVDRSGGKLNLDVPIYSAVSINVPAWEARLCPLCRKKIPFTRLGSKHSK